MAVKVALLDDRQAVRSGIRQMLRSHFDIRILEITERLPEALDRILSTDPDVVLVGEVDHSQDLTTVRWLSTFRAMAGFRILLLRDVQTRSEVTQLLAAGAHGYVPPTADEDQLASSVIMVARGGNAFLPGLSSPVPDAEPEAAPESTGLTGREFSVLSALGRGLSNSEIAKELSVSEATVKKHLSSVMQKTGQRDRLRAGLYAYRHGLA